MTSIFDTLYERRPVLRYVCPPVCEVLFSGSGSPVIILGDFPDLNSPGGVFFGGLGNFHLRWNRYPGALCYSVYRSDTPDGPLVLVEECIPDPDIPLPPGCYRVSAITLDGETSLSDPVCYFVPPMLPPEVTTLPASDIAATQAILNATVNPVGQDTTAQFEWGLTIAYGNLTTLQPMGDGFSDAPLSELITGLSPNTLYHFRAIGSNYSGAGEGADMTFTTPASGGGFTVFGEYWTYENIYVGEVNGIVLTPFGAVFDTGIIGQGARIAATNTTQGVSTGDEPAITNFGTGITFAGWCRINTNTLGTVNMRVAQWSWSPNDFSTNGGSLSLNYDRGTDSFVVALFDDVASPGTITVSIPNPVAHGEWSFIVAWYDPADLRLRVQINNGAVTTSVDTLVVLPYADGFGNFSQLTQAFTGGTYDLQFDESMIHQGVLDSTQRDFLWNTGDGRTYPFV